MLAAQSALATAAAVLVIECDQSLLGAQDLEKSAWEFPPWSDCGI